MYKIIDKSLNIIFLCHYLNTFIFCKTFWLPFYSFPHKNNKIPNVIILNFPFIGISYLDVQPMNTFTIE